MRLSITGTQSPKAGSALRLVFICCMHFSFGVLGSSLPGVREYVSAVLPAMLLYRRHSPISERGAPHSKSCDCRNLRGSTLGHHILAIMAANLQIDSVGLETLPRHSWSKLFLEGLLGCFVVMLVNLISVIVHS